MFLFPKVDVDLSTLAERRTITTTVIPYMVWKGQINPSKHFIVRSEPGRLMDWGWRDKLLQKLCSRKTGRKLATFHSPLSVSVKELNVHLSLYCHPARYFNRKWRRQNVAQPYRGPRCLKFGWLVDQIYEYLAYPPKNSHQDYQEACATFCKRCFASLYNCVIFCESM